MYLKITEHFNTENLHHAYLIEGEKSVVVPTILDFLKFYKLESNDSDLCQITIDNFKIDEAFDLKRMSRERSIGSKKFFIIAVNHFSPEAQNTLLKMFEEPIADTHFFIITPNVNSILPTLLSRFYLITKDKIDDIQDDVEKFIKLDPRGRLDFLKSLLVEPEDEIAEDSVRTKALHFLNSIENLMHRRMLVISDKDKLVFLFEQIFIARKYLRQAGSSPKTILESVTLLLP